nr:uncharacterized protein LOC108947226 [Nicotiana tomentosiformis]
MPFREKWNVSRNNFPLNVDFTFISFFLTSICGGAVVARVPNAIPRFKEWIEGICSQMPCSERRWRNLSKGRWEARSHGLPKTIELRPSVWDEDLSVDPFALGQLGAATGDRGRHNIDRTGKTDRTDNFGFFRFFGRFVVYIFKKFGDRFGFRFWCPNFRLNRKTEILVYRFWWALLHLLVSSPICLPNPFSIFSFKISSSLEGSYLSEKQNIADINTKLCLLFSTVVFLAIHIL